MLLQPVILSGGSGTRLWPLSREQHPKQLLSLFNNETMLQETALRVQNFQSATNKVGVAEQLIVVCNEEYRFITAEQLRTVGLEKCSLILEPIGRNTAPALTLAALKASQKDQDSLLLIMPADHVISDRAAFHAAIDQGIPHAIAGGMVTFGIVPTHPETGYGYIKIGPKSQLNAAHSLDAFFEKPCLEVAQAYLDEKNYLWNSGIFLVRSSVWLRAIETLNPAIYRSCEQALNQQQLDGEFVRLEKASFLSCPSDSIDYAVMEKLNQSKELNIPAWVVPLQAGWSDVGAWDSVWKESPKDSQGNSLRGDVLLENSRNCLVVSDSRLVACLGLEDVIVVETADAVLVTNKTSTVDMKLIINRLKDENYSQKHSHRKVFRPWGHYDSIDSGPHFQVKRIVVKPGGRLSMQMHQHRAEHWIVVSGAALVTRGDEVMTLLPNQSTYIPLGVKHRLENTGSIDLELIEVQSGDYLGEDDIIRFDDIYGRIAST
jgi:mannose-1-phosphate guanylyltransferase/mannose-6-phosphate isomerase